MRAADRARALARERPVWLPLALLVVVQWIAVAVFATRVDHNGWLFYQGGDQTWFYTSGWMLSGGHIPETFVGWVWALAMAPVAAVFGPNFLSAVPAVVLFQVVFLLPLGLLLVYAIATRIGGRALGLWAAAWWVAIPYAIIPLFVERYHERFVDQALPQGLGLTGLGDFPSMIVVLGSALFAVRVLETRATEDVVAAGLLAGLAIGIKPANGLFLFAPVVALLLARNARAVAAFGVALLPGLVVLALWKHRGSGIVLLSLEAVPYAAAAEPDFSPPSFWERAREYVPLDHHQINQQFIYFREYFWSARLLEWVPVAGLVAVARRSVPIAAFLAVWLAAFFVIKGSSPSVSVETGSFWRLMMPAWPAYFLLAASLPLLVPRLGVRLAERSFVGARPLRGRRVLVLAAVVGFALPAAAFAALPPDDTGRAGQIQLRSLFLPIDAAFQPQGQQLAGGVLELSWDEPEDVRARPFYVLLRSPTRYTFPGTEDVVTRGIRCRTPGGAYRCTIEMEEISRGRARVFSERPPPGSWTYRVGIAANWIDDPSAGDILLVSEPVDVAVG